MKFHTLLVRIIRIGTVFIVVTHLKDWFWIWTLLERKIELALRLLFFRSMCYMFLYMHISLFKYAGIHDLEKYINYSCSSLWHMDVPVNLFNSILSRVKNLFLPHILQPLLAAIVIVIGLMKLVTVDINFYRSVLENFQ